MTHQIRLFIAALGLRYACSADVSMRDAEALMAAVLDRDETAAVQCWNDKMSRAVGYMVRQLP